MSPPPAFVLIPQLKVYKTVHVNVHVLVHDLIKSDCNGFGSVKIIIIITVFFIFRPYGTLEITGNGVAINILSLAGHFSGFLPTIHYEQSKTIFKTFQKMVELHYFSKVYEKHFQLPLINPETCSVRNKIFIANVGTINIKSR